MVDLSEEGRQRAIEEYRRVCAAFRYQPPDLSWVPKFRALLREAIASTPIPERLKTASAVILERIASGGGGTNWYYCADATRLDAVEELSRPGSLISFYFDDRIKRAPYSCAEMKAMAANSKYLEEDFNLGALKKDGVTIAMVLGVCPDEFIEYDEEWSSAPFVFYGSFPDYGNDGFNVVTIPDQDGVVRTHAY